MIPAFEAERTLAATLDSLAAQTCEDWEAIVVDDGSADGTAAVVRERMAHDPRLRLVQQANGGVSRARNAGMEHARGRWLAFLDADDWLEPDAYETLLGVLAANSRLDGVHCGWTRVAPDGRTSPEICPHDAVDMLPWHSHNCGFAIHAVLVRRELVERTGGFDPALTTCEDWDMWLRLSRLGTRWARVERQLAWYRIRERSASMGARQMLHDGLVVIDRAHAPDPRLRDVPPDRRAGVDVAQRARARLVHAVYSAGLAVGQGHDAVELLAPVAEDRCEDLAPDAIAYALLEGIPLGAGTVPADWPSFSAELIDRVSDLLVELERISEAPRLARRVKQLLDRLVEEEVGVAGLFGRLEHLPLDLERPLEDLLVPREVERVMVQPRYGSQTLAPIELPTWEGRVPAPLVADAVAAEHAWSVLAEFLAARPDAPSDVEADGWERLLQETWGDRDSRNADFYAPERDGSVRPNERREVGREWAVVELTGPLPELASARTVPVVATLAGATVTTAELEPSDGIVSAGALRREITTRAGFELCRVAVREGLIGRPCEGGPGLRERLREVAAARAAATPRPPCAPPVGVALAPGWRAHAARALDGAADGWVIARRRGAEPGRSGTRIPLLPPPAAPQLLAAAWASGDPVIAVGRPGAEAPVAYAPDVVWRDDARRTARRATRAARAARPRASVATQLPQPPRQGRAFFEALFAAGSDPWGYTNAYEQGKYEQTLALLPARPQHALELACAEGHFTQQLAGRAERLHACDISAVALARARERCAGLSHVSFGYHDLFEDPIHGRYDAIVCSEVLYYAGDRARLDRSVARIAAALEPGGTLVTAHANVVADEPEGGGFEWGVPFGARTIADALGATGLELVRELANPLYRVQAWQRPHRRARLRRPAAVREEAALPSPLPPDVARHFRWHGGPVPAPEEDEPVTWELPILMYHRVAPDGSERLREWRVTPDQFEQQLHYLRTAGFETATFEEWWEAAEGHRPLPGRRVMLTFDDGYEDFAEHAHPLLRQYELEATVFVVSDRVGATNEWDRAYGETLPLMGWGTLRALDGDFVRFGGHSATHPMMAALGLDEVVREASRCRAELARQLGHAVNAFAYPYGDMDAAVARTVGGCGFEFAVTTAGFPAPAWMPMLTLPRMNVAGTDSFDAFVRMLVPPAAVADR